MKLAGLTQAQFRRWLSRLEPQLIAGLHAAWAQQEGDISDLRAIERAMREGDFTDAEYERLEGAYALFVRQELASAWGASALLVHRDLGRALTSLAGATPSFEIFRRRLDEAFGTHTSTLLRSLSSAQREVIQGILSDAIPAGLSPSSVASLLRPVIPLDPRSARAVAALRQRLASSGSAPREVQRQGDAYADSLRSVRALRIARTEGARGYHAADHALLEESEAQGLTTRTRRTWDTSGDERTCPFCGSLDGRTVGLSDPFNVAGWTALYPPIHPGCRCTLTFDVIATPKA